MTPDTPMPDDAVLVKLAQALHVLHRRGWSPRETKDGRVWFDTPVGDSEAPEAVKSLRVIHEHGDLAKTLLRWPPASWRSAARFKTAEALLYPLLGSVVATMEGDAVLRRVLDGWAQVSGIDGRTRKVRASQVEPIE